MTNQNDYVPFGDEWRKEMSKWRKSDLIELLRSKLIAEKEAKNLSSNSVLADSFQPIPLIVYEGVVAEKQRVIHELNIQIKENTELKQEIINLHKIIAARKLAENFR